MAAELVLASRSAHKAREVAALLGSAARATVLTLDALQIPVSPAEDDVENGPTFVANALAKARLFAQRLQRPVLADDSGLQVDALGGAPGVRTKRFALDHGVVATGQQLDEANIDLLLHKLADAPDHQRGARYVCAAAVVYPDGSAITAVGTVSGQIARARSGSGGFGYDPVFFLPERSATFAQLTAEEKNHFSHRARAFRALAGHLK